MKKIFLLFLLCFAVNGYSDAANFEVGDVFESKKRTTSVVLYKFKADLLMLLRNIYQPHRSKTGSFRNLEPRYKYDLQKGDKIILLVSLEERGKEIFQVALVPKKKAIYQNNPYYYVVPDNFNQLVFVQHLTE